MEIKPYFRNIKKTILENLTEAKQDIYIAMAWFTNHEIFDVILKKVEQIPIHLVVINDDINNRLDGLDFQRFIDKGGKFYFGKPETPMHNKFCIIDSNVLITGSYNYTYLAESINDENILVFKGTSDVISDFKIEFNNIVSNLHLIKSISEYLKSNPYKRDSFSFNNYGKRDIYQHCIEMKSLGFDTEAESLLNKLELKSESNSANDFVISDVIYRQWRQDYYADKIEVLENTLILHFRTTSSSNCTVYCPTSIDAWVLRDSKKKSTTTKATKITNVKFNGHEINNTNEIKEDYHFSSEGLTSPSKIHFDSSTNGKKNFDLTCEIHFNIENFSLETVDLVEGLQKEEATSHWHCFDINLILNREKTVANNKYT
ncbi:phospholipase D-like domain-containing protein [Carboxylicivirga sp. RSCT41]|uniref:phospholipase D-like domain-containing protein n=1 Tax=Carboxylicivirga agarovorans TaxID=3417570 RepID=UPI003D349008